MQKKTTILLSTIAVVVLAVILLIAHFHGVKQENEGKADTNAPKVERPVAQKKEENNCQTVGQEKENKEESEVSVGENNSIEQTNASGGEPQAEDIQTVNINIVDMKDEVKAEIKDMQAFEYAIKEFFYKAGIMQEEVKCLNKVTFDYQEGRVIYQMYVRSNTATFFEVVYEISNNTFSVLY